MTLKQITSISNVEEVKISLDYLGDALFPVHQRISEEYRSLPWPPKIQKIVVFTEVQGGRGDVAAAAKIIDFLQTSCPTLTFDWVLWNAALNKYNPRDFLRCKDPSKIHIREWQCESIPPDKAPGDFLLVGPVAWHWDLPYLEGRLARKIVGPIFSFLENARELSNVSPGALLDIVKKATGDPLEIYAELHSMLFPSASHHSFGSLPMGLQSGSGVLTEPGRIEAPLSRNHCCPSYLTQIRDIELRRDILEAMEIFDGQSQPDYDRYSFNAGYAHHCISLEKFIDCVAIHEEKKHVVIVLNQKGYSNHLSTQELQEHVFTAERLAFLHQKGYGTIRFKGDGQQQAVTLQEASEGRRLTMIVRPYFSPEDMRLLQLAAERLLATGDNSAVEALCARCILYLYEDVDNVSCKNRFLQQQVDEAKKISPILSQLLALFGGDKRLPNYSLNKPLNAQQMAEIECLLHDPDLSDATLRFCNHIVKNFSFYKVVEGALKRVAWHYLCPELSQIEATALDESFRLRLVAYLQAQVQVNEEMTPDKVSELSLAALREQQRTLRVENIPELGQKVRARVFKELPTT